MCISISRKLGTIDIILSQNVSSFLAICQVNNIYLPPTMGRDATYIGQKDTVYLTQADRESSHAGAF